MMACDDFVFLHLHKSGGTFVNEMVMRHFPGAHLIGYHLPIAYLPEAYRDRPIFGAVRNPWAYYVSWYHYQAAQRQPNALFLVCSDQGRRTFLETVQNLVMLADDDSRIDALVRALPARFPNRGINMTKNCISSIRGTGLGFFSFLYHRHYGSVDAIELLRTETLRSQLRAYLERFSPVNRPALEFVAVAPPLNISRHRPYRFHYNTELAELIHARDKVVIARHDYNF